jgi:hypothetical protein
LKDRTSTKEVSGETAVGQKEHLRGFWRATVEGQNEY